MSPPAKIFTALVLGFLALIFVAGSLQTPKAATITTTNHFNDVPPASVAATEFSSRWSTALDDAPVAAPIVTTGTVVVTLPNRLVAFDRNTGTRSWQVDLTARSINAVVANGTVAVTSNRSVVGYDLSSGAKRWAWDAPATIEQRLTADDSHVFAVTTSRIDALDATSGTAVWHHDDAPQDLSEPAVDRIGQTLAYANGLTIFIVRASDGFILKSWPAPTTPTTTPAHSGAFYFFDTDHGEVFAVDTNGRISVPVKKTGPAWQLIGDDLGGVVVVVSNQVFGGVSPSAGYEPWNIPRRADPSQATPIPSGLRILVPDRAVLRAVNPIGGYFAGSADLGTGGAFLQISPSVVDGDLAVITANPSGQVALQVIRVTNKAGGSRQSTVDPSAPR